MAAAMLFACDGNVDNGDGSVSGSELKLTADKTIIQTFDGDFATLSVTLDGEAVTEEVVFYKGKGKDKKPIALPDFRFATEEAGEHVLTASYGTYISEELTIKAISVELPAVPADPNPGSTDFKARMLVTEVTTTGCTYCPGMKSILHPALEDKDIEGKVVFATCHNTTMNSVADPAYIHTSYASYSPPYILCDMFDGFGYYRTWGANDVIKQLNSIYEDKRELGPAAGIAVNSSLVGGQLVARATVKPSATANYRIGAFLLEDGVYGKQTGGGVQDWMSTHNNVVRYIDSQYYAGQTEMFFGHSLGKLESGKTADYVFVWDLDAIWAAGTKKCDAYAGSDWAPRKDENLHIAVFVTTLGETDKGDQFYYVNNVTDCPANGSVPYEYR